MSFDPITHPLRGAHSIEASAGTGKTYSITLLWLRLLVEEKLKVEQILVSTFTKAATAELRERLLHSLRNARNAALTLESGNTPEDGPESRIVSACCSQTCESAAELRNRLTLALSQFDLAPISTIHSFCQQLIARYAVELACDANLAIRENADSLLHPFVDDQLMRLADTSSFKVEPLRTIADRVAHNPSASLLLPPANPPTPEQETLDRILEVAPLALEGISKANVRSKVEKQIEALRTRNEWEPLSDAATRSLPAELVELWQHLGDQREGEKRLPAGVLAAAVSSRFPERKDAEGMRTFDDLIHTVRRALATQGENGVLASAVRSQLHAAIIDECQDSDGAQIDVFEKLFLHPSTVSFLVIGDPKQSIYRFRGADLASYKKLVARTRPAKPMSTNWRSDKPLIDALNQLYGGHVFPDALLSDLETRYHPVDSPAPCRIEDPALKNHVVFQWTCETRRELARFNLARAVADECQRLLNSGVTIIDRHTEKWRPLHAGDIAVLAASRSQLSMVRRYLTRAAIPSQSPGKSLGSVFNSAEAQDILAWLQMLAALARKENTLPRLLAFLGTPLGGKSSAELSAIAADPLGQSKYYAAFQRELSLLPRNGPLPLLLDRLSEGAVAQINLAHAEGERRFTNWRQLAALLQQEHALGRRGADSLALWLARHIATKSDSVSDEVSTEESALMRLETDAPAVQLMTIHGSKGLEFPIVFCPFLWSVRARTNREETPVAIFRQSSGWALDVGSSEFSANVATALAQEDEEEHRKLYVALTRARHRLYLGIAGVEEGIGGNQNAASDSCLARLPGLELHKIDPALWRSTLMRIPFVHVQDTDPPIADAATPAVGLPASAPRSAAENAPATALLIRPQAVAPYRFPLSRKASFSSLSKSESEQLILADHDEDSDPATGEEGNRGTQRSDIFSLMKEKGAVLGDRLHAVLEDYLGNRRSLAHATESVQQKDAWKEAVRLILNTEIRFPQNSPVSLEQLRPRCMTEMHFQLPLAHVSPKALSEALLADPAIAGNEDKRAWAKHIEPHWKFPDFSGFLQGYIDLLFEHEGRWFVADYKSNRLDDYGPASLEHAMQHHHYLLQARFYVLALHRHLRAHLPDYDYERDFGGVLYLFVRGFSNQGTWFERPSLEALGHLEKLFVSTHP